MYKRNLFLVIVVAFVLSISGCSFEKKINAENLTQNEISVIVNGKQLITDTPPIIESGRTLVPLRSIFEALGAEVDFDNESKTVMANKDGKEISFQIGSTEMWVNGKATVLDVPAQIVNDRTLVPARAVSEALDMDVSWNADSRTVKVCEKLLTVHFIDVGQADAALVQCGGENMLIDGGNSEDSSLVVSYLKSCGVDYLKYVVCSHAHEDHVGGISGPLSVFEHVMAFAPKTELDSKAYQSFKKKCSEIINPRPGDGYDIGNAHFTILGPVFENTNDINNTSIVIKLTYGDKSFLFTGDASRDEESDILSTGADLKADVLKVGHHGSKSATTYPFLREIMPEYAVISVGTGNDYGHPTEETLSRLRDAGVTVFRTDLNGNIIAKTNGKTIEITSLKGEPTTSSVTKEEPTVQTYIGNKNSKKFHKSTCSSLPKEGNSVYFSSREEAINQGYTPCSKCNP